MSPVIFTLVQEQAIGRPEEVFDYLTDFEDRVSFESAVTEVERLSEDPIGRGTRYREVRRSFGMSTTTVHEVVEDEPPRLLRFESVEGPIPLEGHYALGQSSHGSEVTFTLTMSPTGVMGLFGPLIRRQTERDLDRY